MFNGKQQYLQTFVYKHTHVHLICVCVCVSIPNHKHINTNIYAYAYGGVNFLMYLYEIKNYSFAIICDKKKRKK